MDVRIGQLETAQSYIKQTLDEIKASLSKNTDTLNEIKLRMKDYQSSDKSFVLRLNQHESDYRTFKIAEFEPLEKEVKLNTKFREKIDIYWKLAAGVVGIMGFAELTRLFYFLLGFFRI